VLAGAVAAAVRVVVAGAAVVGRAPLRLPWDRSYRGRKTGPGGQPVGECGGCCYLV